MARTARRTRGFWRGLLTGLALAAAAAVGLAIVFPPAIFFPPQVEETRLQAPDPLAQPQGAAGPGRPHLDAEGPARGEIPVVAAVPGAEAAPEIGALRPMPVPEVFGREGALPGLAAPEGGGAAAGLRLAIPASPGGVGGGRPGGLPALGEPPAVEAGPGIGIGVPRLPEAVDAEGAAMPAAPQAPARIEGPEGARSAVAHPAVPLSAERPAVELSPGIGGLAPPAAPTEFWGGGAGAPSLVAPE